MNMLRLRGKFGPPAILIAHGRNGTPFDIIAPPMPGHSAPVLLDYEPAAAQRRDKLWQLALTTTNVHLAFLVLALVLNAFSIPKNIREVQWHALTSSQRFVVWMGYVGLLHALATLTSIIAMISLRRIVHRRSGWP